MMSKEERIRKEEFLAYWKNDLQEYLEVLKAEVQRVSGLLQKDFVVENYDEIQIGYFQPILEYPKDINWDQVPESPAPANERR